VQCGKASGDILRLELTRTIGKFLPGMFVEVQCGRLGALDWHPFTLASPAQMTEQGGRDTIVLYIKAQVCASVSLPLSFTLLPPLSSVLLISISHPVCDVLP